MTVKLGDLLVKDGIVSEEQLQQALLKQKETGESMGECLVKIKAIESVDDLAFTFAKQLNTQINKKRIEEKRFEIDKEQKKLGRKFSAALPELYRVD